MSDAISAAQLAAEHRAGLRDPVVTIDIALRRAHISQRQINAFACFDDGRASESAKGARTGALAGVPVSVKDILDVGGLPTRFGSPLMAQVAPAAVDIVAVQRLRAAGAIVIGKTTTTEFAYSAIGASPLTGHTINPWAAGLTCGGSSLGAGSSVALGVTPVALATDAGCSTRLPAACTATYGLKPTLGAIPHERVPDAFGNFIHLGLIAREIEDLALTLPLLAGPHPNDPQSLFRPPFAPTESRLHGARILVWLRCGNQRVSEEIAANTRAASELLRALGAEVVEAEYDLPHPDPIWRCLQQVNWANRFSAAPAADRALLSAGFNSGIDAGAATSSVAIARAQAGRSAIFRGVQTQFQSGFDFILTPCVSAPPLPLDIDPAAPLMIDGAEAGDLRADWTAYLSLFDLSGHPAIAIPSGLATNGAPLGVQLVARWGDDMRLLAAAMAFSGRLPPPRLPPVDENARED